MKVIAHRDGTYSIKDLRMGDLKDIQASLEMRGLDFASGAEASSLPWHYRESSWTLEQYRDISKVISERHYELAEILKPYAYPA